MVFWCVVVFLVGLSGCSQFIVQFRSQWTTKHRRKFFERLYPQNQFSYEIIKRNNISTDPNFLSDFTVIETECSEMMESLSKNDVIKRITEQREYEIQEYLSDSGHSPFHTSSKSLFSSFQSQDIPQTRKKDVPSLLKAKRFWRKGLTCKGIKIAVFDTGLKRNHPLFNNIVDIINFTDEESSDDLNGHGTIIAGIIGARNDIKAKSKTSPTLVGSSGKKKPTRCRGLCPDAELYIFKVFNKKSQALTSWFLDAFNYALKLGIHIINLSNGGRDHYDYPFVEKVNELTAKNVLIVSAIGNKGPFYGTLFNPGDMPSVIGVGGITYQDEISLFSSRGSSTSELQHGYGIVKPDLVTFSNDVLGVDPKGYCTTRSGTSLASPIVAGSIALLASAFPPEVRWNVVNSASIRQVFYESSLVLPGTSLFEQGGGKLRLLHAYHTLLDISKPKTTIFPPRLDITDCPTMSPFCYQPIYFKSLPMIINLTIHNSVSVFSTISRPPIFIDGRNGFLLEISFEYDENVWPFSGTLSVHISANSKSMFFLGIAEGLIEVEMHHHPLNMTEIVHVPLRIRIVRPPKKEKRLLWDVYHNIQFPPSFVPSDDLFQSEGVKLDMLGDHPHTNFYDLFMYLRTEGYFVGTLMDSFTSLDQISSDFSTLVMMDLEEEYTVKERDSLLKLVKEDGLNLLIVGNWYSIEVLERLTSWDEETKRIWRPITGGANIPALNALLDPVGISFGDGVWEGKFDFSKKKRKKNLFSYFFGSSSSSSSSYSSSSSSSPPSKYSKRYYSNNRNNQGRSKKNRMKKDEMKLSDGSISNRMKGIIASGTRIIRFPKNGYLWYEKLVDRTGEIIQTTSWGTYSPEKRVPILGMTEYGMGRIVVFGDTGCLDSQTVGVLGPKSFGESVYDRFKPKKKFVFKEESCFEFFQALLEYTATGKIPEDLTTENKMEHLSEEYVDAYTTDLPRRPSWNDFWEFSKVEMNEHVTSTDWIRNRNDTKYGRHSRYIPRSTSTTLYVFVFLLSAAVLVFMIVMSSRGGRSSNIPKPMIIRKIDYYEKLQKDKD